MRERTLMEGLQSDLQLPASLLGVELPSRVELPTDKELQQLDTDARAGRRKSSRQCHPDRGGSHEQQVNINLAFNVLRSYVELCQSNLKQHAELLKWSAQMTETLLSSLRAKQQRHGGGSLSVELQQAAAQLATGTLPAAAVRIGEPCLASGRALSCGVQTREAGALLASLSVAASAAERNATLDVPAERCGACLPTPVVDCACAVCSLKQC